MIDTGICSGEVLQWNHNAPVYRIILVSCQCKLLSMGKRATNQNDWQTQRLSECWAFQVSHELLVGLKDEKFIRPVCALNCAGSCCMRERRLPCGNVGIEAIWICRFLNREVRIERRQALSRYLGISYMTSVWRWSISSRTCGNSVHALVSSSKALTLLKSH